MSSCTIYQEHDRFTFAVDTAYSIMINGSIYRKKGLKVDKIHEIGKDVVFVAGMEPTISETIEVLPKFLNKKNHLNITELQRYLRKKYPDSENPFSKERMSQIGLAVMAISNGESLLMQLCQGDHNYKLSETRTLKNYLAVAGIKGDVLFNKAQDIFSKTLDRRNPRLFMSLYQNNYYEGIGGEILVYSLDDTGLSLIHREELKEIGLKFSDDIKDKDIQMQLRDYYTYNTKILGSHISGDRICGGEIRGVTLSGSTFNRTEDSVVWSKIDEDGFYQNVSGDLKFQVGNYSGYGYIYSNVDGITLGSPYYHNVAINQNGVFIDSQTPVTSGNIASQSVRALRETVYVSAENNFRPYVDGSYSCGTTLGRWSSVWAVNGVIQTSDRNKKNTIQELDDRYLKFAKLLMPKSFRMNEGTSGRTHVGFIAQEVEEAMTACGITDMEFAGLIKSPIYSKKLVDDDGNEINEYDTTSVITGYDYALRYDEFIPLLFAGMKAQEDRIAALENKLSI